MANEFFAARPGEATNNPNAAESPNPNSFANGFDGEVPLGSSALSPVILPGEAELRAVLDAIALASGGPLPGAPADPIASSDPLFYFSEYAQSGPQVSTPKSNDLQVSLQGFRGPFDVAAIRRDFPILEERMNGRPLVWLDNAATTQKPRAVIGR